MTGASPAPDMPAEATDGPRARAWFSLILLLLLYMCSMLDRNIINVLVVPIKQEYGLGDFEMGVLLGPAFGLAYVALAFPLAWLGDRWSRRGVTFIGVIVWSISNMVAGLTTSYEALLMARIGVGAGEAALLPAAYGLIAQLFPRHGLAFALSIFSMGTIGGMSVGFGLGGWLLDHLEAGVAVPVFGHLESWRAVFFITGLPSLILAFLLYLVPERKSVRPASGVSGAEPLFQFIRQNPWSALGIPAAFALAAMPSAVLLSWLPAYAMPAFGWSATMAGSVVAGLLLVPATIGKIGAGLMVDWLFSRGVKDAHVRFLFVALIIAAPCAVGAFFVGPVLFVALLGIWFLLAYPIQGYSAAAIQLVTPESFRGRISAIFTIMVNLLAAGIGPVVVGFLSDFAFTGPRSLGLAIVANLALWAPLGILLLWKVLPVARAAVDRTTPEVQS